jgi:hypothetical protein
MRTGCRGSRRRSLALCAATAGLLLVSCDPTSDRPLEWSYLHPAIIAPSCATSSCHSELAETADLALDDAETSLDTLLDRQYVLPGDPDSPLIYLLEGNERPRMPPDAPLPRTDVDSIRAWIEQGAPP